MSGFFFHRLPYLYYFTRGLRALTCLLNTTGEYRIIIIIIIWRDSTAQWTLKEEKKNENNRCSRFFFFWHCPHASTRASTLRAYAYAPIDVKTMPLTKRKRPSRGGHGVGADTTRREIYACVTHTILATALFSHRLQDVLQRTRCCERK